MQWYYAIDGERNGPVSEQEFAQLIANGVVTGGYARIAARA
ncbi:MAG: DUF4339 domain-containing protein [Candidatus Synoicihabitans palmerolidicus]|nr:DUF4339 domain-containing protein [Candidatus Synoicihabitans palmerolidicus]